jgi:hypothetical protein
MLRIGGRAILAHREARGIVGVEPVVAIDTQAAERTQPERGEVASMRRDVVGDGRWRDAVGLQAKPTQWFDMQLMRPAALPASGAIPAVDIRTVRQANVPVYASRVSPPALP